MARKTIAHLGADRPIPGTKRQAARCPAGRNCSKVKEDSSAHRREESGPLRPCVRLFYANRSDPGKPGSADRTSVIGRFWWTGPAHGCTMTRTHQSSPPGKEAVMLQPRPGPSLHQLRRANRRWRGLALIALLGLV